jgi:hypothetical protein
MRMLMHICWAALVSCNDDLLCCSLLPCLLAVWRDDNQGLIQTTSAAAGPSLWPCGKNNTTNFKQPWSNWRSTPLRLMLHGGFVHGGFCCVAFYCCHSSRLEPTHTIN